MSQRAINLAAKLNLILLIDKKPVQQGRCKPQYIVDDTIPAQHIKLLPKGHWVVHRAINARPCKDPHKDRTWP